MPRSVVLRALFLLSLLTAPLAADTSAVLDGPGLEEGESIRVFRLEHAEVGGALTILRSILGVRHIGALEAPNTIFLRDSAERLDLAAGLLDGIDRPRPTVAIEFRLIAIDLAKASSAGRSGVFDAARPPARLSPDRLKRLLDSDGIRLLSAPRLDVATGETGRLHLGERIPIRANDAGTVDYQDIGLEVRVTPRIHGETDEIALHLQIGSSRRNDDGATPVVATSEIDSRPRLPRGESLVLSDLIFGAGLAEEAEDAELILVVTPRLGSTD